MCCCDDNPAKVCGMVRRKARKEHECSECRRVIRRGETYEEHSGLWDGGWETFRWCAHCAAAVKVVEKAVEDFCFCYSALWDELVEIERYGRPNKPVSRIRAGVRRKWTHKRGPRAGQLMPVPAHP